MRFLFELPPQCLLVKLLVVDLPKFLVLKYITIRGFINRNGSNQLFEPRQKVKIFIIVQLLLQNTNSIMIQELLRTYEFFKSFHLNLDVGFSVTSTTNTNRGNKNLHILSAGETAYKYLEFCNNFCFTEVSLQITNT